MRDERGTTSKRMRRGALAMAGGLVVVTALTIAPLALGQTTTAPAPTPAATAAPAATATKPRVEPTLPPGAVVVATATAASPADGAATVAATATTVATVGATPTATVEVVGYRSTTAQLGEIVWARRVDADTGEPTSRASGFITTDDVIYASIPVQRIAMGVTISAQWSYDGQLVEALTTRVTTIADARPGWLVFQVDLPEGEIWPIGGYVIDVYVDGQFALKASVLVSVPPPS